MICRPKVIVISPVEHGVSWEKMESMENMEKMEKMENINQVT